MVTIQQPDGCIGNASMPLLLFITSISLKFIFYTSSSRRILFLFGLLNLQSIKTMKRAKLPVINRSLNSGPVWYQNNWTDFPTSEQRSEYIGHKLTHSVDYSPRFTYSISNIPFNDFTEYRDNYPLNKRNYSQNFLRRRDQIQLSKIPMESTSIYNNEFKSKDSVKAMPVKPKSSQLDFVFNDKENKQTVHSSLYKSDFKKWEKENSKMVSFKENVFDNQNASTDYQENFQKPPPSRLVMPQPIYKKPIVPFASDTSYNITFVKHPYSKESLMLPTKSNLSVENKPFVGQSLYKSDYVEKERDNGNSELNIYQNPSSFLQTISHGNWYDKYPSQEFKEFRNTLFYQK